MTVLQNSAAAIPAAEDTPKTGAVHAEPGISVRVTLEVALYVAMAVLAGVLRLAQLGHAPLTDAEAREALAALHAIQPGGSGVEVLSTSPLTHFLNALSFTLLTASDFAARFPVALGGWLLALAPLLWRRYLNPLPTLILSALLAISPVALLASRTGSPVIWSALLAVVAPALVLRFVETRRAGWGVAATAALATLALLAESTGFLMLLMLVFGVGFAWLTEDDPDARPGKLLRDVLRDWPWANGALAAAVAGIVIGTGLLLLPSGLAATGNGLWAGLRGFVERPEGNAIALPMWIALRYEPAIILFGLLAAYRALRQGNFFERALVGWFVLGLVLSLVYAGGTPGHALWITLPLTILLSLSICRWLTEIPGVVFRVPDWGLPLYVLITFALWVAVGMSLILLSKQLLDLPAGITDLGELARALFGSMYSRSTVDAQTVVVQDAAVFGYTLGFMQLRVLVTILVTLLVGVLFFLVGSLWGARMAWRGLALGTFSFLLLFGVGLGWRGTFLHYDDPREIWYPRAVTGDVQELRDTLREMSLRANGTPHLIPITAQIPGDGALAWALHGFPNVTLVTGVGPEVDTAAVIVPADTWPEELGGAYVGKDLVIRRAWTARALTWRDALAWLHRDETYLKPVPDETIMLWIRGDVYGVEQVTAEE